MRLNRLAHIYYFFFFFLFLFQLLSSNSHAMMSISEEREFGEKLLKEVLSQVTLIDDPEIIHFVQETGESILKVINGKYFHYRFFVIKDPALNAFAMPGGLVFVHSGLLEAVSSQNELACVLAHEFGHVQGRHVAKRMEKMKYVSIGTAVMAIAGLFLGKGDVGSAILTGSMALGQSLALKYSRVDEQEGDRRAFQWICKAGYDPRGLVSTLQKMMKNNWLGNTHIPKYLSTHPVPEERITYLEDLWKNHPCYLKIKKDPFELKRIQTKIRVITKPEDQTILYFKNLLKKSPNDLMGLYGYALSLDKARRFNDSIKTYKKILELYPEREIFNLDMAITLFHMGEYKRAIKILKAFLRHDPQNVTAKYFLARSYLEAGLPLKALRYFKMLLPSWEDKPQFLFQLGRCYGGLRQNGIAHYYFYKYFTLTGKNDTAKYHKNRALALLPKDSPFYKKLSKEKGE